LDDHFKNEMVGACGMDGGRGAYMVLVLKPEGRNHWKVLGINGRILNWIF
jgi:hypothetical protein